jgi:hypothetical protein
LPLIVLSVRIVHDHVAVTAIGDNFNLQPSSFAAAGVTFWQDVQILDARWSHASSEIGRQIPLVTKRGPQSQPN